MKTKLKGNQVSELKAGLIHQSTKAPPRGIAFIFHGV